MIRHATSIALLILIGLPSAAAAQTSFLGKQVQKRRIPPWVAAGNQSRISVISSAQTNAQVAAAPVLGGGVTWPLAGRNMPEPGGGFVSSRREFTGWVTIPRGVTAWVAIDALKQPDLDPTVEANWKYDVLIARPGTPVSGGIIPPSSYYWRVEDTRSKIFRSFPERGIGRFRAVWVKSAKPTLPWGTLTHHDYPQSGSIDTGLPLITRHGTILEGPQGLPIDSTIATLSALDGRRGFEHFTDLNQQLAQTRRYYDHIGTNPDGTGITLPTKLPTLAAFRERYFTPGLTETQVQYYNHGDLGIGRDMHCVFSTVESACYVSNYAPLNPNGTPKFKDLDGTRTIMRQLPDPNVKPFATVAMVERGGMSRFDPSRVFFVVYDSNGDLLLDQGAQLDASGYNTAVPHNCMVCHGGSGSFDQSRNTVTGAHFLPFDMDAILTVTDSQQTVHDAFRTLNRQIYFISDTGLLPNARIIRSWYGSDFTSGKFNGEAVPDNTDWEGNHHRGRLYTKFYARPCRSCHISQEGAFSFSDYALLEAQKGIIKLDTCDTFRMPNSAVQLDTFWQLGARGYFFGHMPGVFGNCTYPLTIK